LVTFPPTWSYLFSHTLQLNRREEKGIILVAFPPTHTASIDEERGDNRFWCVPSKCCYFLKTHSTKIGDREEVSLVAFPPRRGYLFYFILNKERRGTSNQFWRVPSTWRYLAAPAQEMGEN
jgi:hypothetical protein